MSFARHRRLQPDALEYYVTKDAAKNGFATPKVHPAQPVSARRGPDCSAEYTRVQRRLRWRIGGPRAVAWVVFGSCPQISAQPRRSQCRFSPADTVVDGAVVATGCATCVGDISAQRHTGCAADVGRRGCLTGTSHTSAARGRESWAGLTQCARTVRAWDQDASVVPQPRPAVPCAGW